jgi:hypothetical protein
MQIYTNNIILLYLSYKCTIHVNNFLFLVLPLRVSMFLHHPGEFLIYAKITKLIKGKLLYMVTEFLYLLDKYSKIIQNARYVHHEE